MEIIDANNGERPAGTKKNGRDEQTGTSKRFSAAEIQTWLARQIADLLYTDAENIDVRETFNSFGLSSREAVMLSGDLEDWLGRRISPTILYEYPTIEALATFLGREEAGTDHPGASQPARGEKDGGIEDEASIEDDACIAITGMECRFPGAKDRDSFWKMLLEGVDAVSEIPTDRWDAQAFFDPDPAAVGKMYTRWGGFVKDVDQFDPQFFGISPREAVRMDPQQRLLLEVAWEALESAGYAPDRLAGSNTGVFIGISSNDYSLLQHGEYAGIDAYTGTGNAFCIAANRISYSLGLHGPSFAVDTACSSSLVSVHLACQSLRKGEVDLALAGGVNLILSPELNITFSRAHMMSPDGRCKTFDAAADGYVRGEGCGVVVLKRLADAVRDGDPIWSVIRGSAVNHDGHSNGITAPNGLAHQDVIRKALNDARLKPEQIGYVEAHGTGTVLGDPIEIEALGAVMQDRPPGDPCMVGSVKTNIGHLEAAAGVAGLIKTALILQHAEIPPHLHLKEVNPYIPLNQLPLEIPTRRKPWQSNGKRRLAGVSSFGFGGTNAHIILEEPPARSFEGNAVDRTWHLLCLSARDERALKDQAARFGAHLSAHPEQSLANICYTANHGRAHFDYRLAVIAETAGQMQEKLADTAGRSAKLIPSRRPKIAFLFTGQGAQYPGMGRQLYQTQPTFRKTLDRCAEILSADLEQPLLEVVFGEGEAADRLNETGTTQPALFALEYALAQMWFTWGIRPDYVMGHSVGEYVAACLAGVFSLEDGLKLIALRGKLMQGLPQDGEMAVVLAKRDRVEAALSRHPGAVDIAASNGPENTVISGLRGAVRQVVQALEAEGIVTRPLKVSHAFHSPLMEPILDEFERTAQQVVFQEPQLGLVSNLTGRIFGKGEVPGAEYWKRHIRGAVQFHAGILALAEAGVEVYLEAGPNPTLLGMGRRCLPEVEADWLPTLKKDVADWQVALESLGRLYERGAEVDWKGFDGDYSRSTVQAPTYPFQRERFWVEPVPARYGGAIHGGAIHDGAIHGGGNLSQSLAGLTANLNGKAQVHPLLGHRLSSPLPMPQFETQLNLQALPYLAGFNIHGAVLYPASACLEMALAAGREIYGGPVLALVEANFPKRLLLSANSTKSLQLILSSTDPERAAFEIYAAGGDAEPVDRIWSLLSSGKMQSRQLDENDSPAEYTSLEEIKSRCLEIPVELYDRVLEERGVRPDPGLVRNVRIWRGEAEALASFEINNESGLNWDAYLLPPPLLERAFQVLFATWVGQGRQAARIDPYLPVRVCSLRMVHHPFGRIWSHVTLVSQDPDEAWFEGKIHLRDEQGRVIAEADGVIFERLDPDTRLAIQGMTEDLSNEPAQDGKTGSQEASRELPEVQMTREMLLASPARQRETLLEVHLRNQLASVLGLDPSRINPRQPINYLGLDSILAIELKTQIERSLGANLPMSSLLRGPTTAGLAAELLDQISEGSAAEPGRPTASGHGAGEYPLSLGQKAMWFQHQISPESIFNPVYAVRIRSSIAPSRLKEAFQALVDRHPALRTTFRVLNGEPVQVVHEEGQLFFHQEDAASWDPVELRIRLSDEAGRRFDLENGPLLRIYLFSEAENQHILMLAAHHIVIDLWSLVVLIHELHQIIAAPNPQAILPKIELQYPDYARWQSEMLAGEKGEALWEYWREKLKGKLPVLELPTDRPRPAVQTFNGATQSIRLDQDLTQKLSALSERFGTTLYMTLLAAFKVLLFRYTGQEDLIVGTPTTGRTQAGLAELVGYFVNSVALRSQLWAELKFSDFLGQVRQTVLEALEHQDYPVALLVEKLKPERDASHLPVFQVMFILQRAHLLNEEGLSKFAAGMDGLQMNLSGLEIESVTVEQRQSPFELSLMMAGADGGLAATMTYNTDLFDPETIVKMLGHYRTLLEGVVVNPDREISILPLLTESERHLLLVDWNDTGIDFPQDRCIHELFEAQVAQRPQATAVIFEDQTLTYAELDRRANQLAHYLRRLGVGPEGLVAISTTRSLEMITGILGILKAGGAYLPLDPTYPTDRLAFMLADSQAPVLLTQAGLLPRLPAYGGQVVRLDADWEPIARESEAPPASGVRPDHLAYVIYTSGSTGRPKGAMLQHRGLCNLARVQRQAFGVGAGSRVLQFSAFSFDASVWETFMALANGGTLVLARGEVLAGGAELVRLLEEGGVSQVTLPPSVLRVLPGAALPGLKTVISAGEACTAELVGKWGGGREFYNAYGPTETTVCATLYRWEGSGRGAPPIGRPVGNTQVYILDRELQPVPRGVPGELHVGGVSLARGYLNRPELTAERFIANPFSGEPGQRLYKTGDLVRYLPDGNLEFLGRIDQQVKIRGFRIELGEIESVLSQHPEVNATVVLVREDPPGHKRLVAYIIPSALAAEEDESGSSRLKVPELKSYLQEKLPEYMVPGAFVFLDELPLMPNGKVDRRALPAPDQNRIGASSAYVAPRTPEEEILVEICAQVLGLEQNSDRPAVGVQDNFFELGGDSILSIQVISRVNQAGLRLTPRQLFEHPTIEALAAVAEKVRSVRANQGIVEGSVPLAPAQVWFFEQEFTESHHWNRSLLLAVPHALDPVLLENAMQILMDHHDALRLRFILGDTGWVGIEPGSCKEVPFTYVDLAGRTGGTKLPSGTELPGEEWDQVIAEQVESLQASLDLEKGPLVRIACFNLGEEDGGRLFMTAHHLVVDDISWPILLEDFQAAYDHLEQGRDVRLPPKTTSYQDWSKSLVDYLDAGQVTQELDYWLSIPKQEALRLPLDFTGGLNTEANERRVSVSLTGEETGLLFNEVPAAYRTETPEILLTALAQALSFWTGSQVILVDLPGHGRDLVLEGIDVSRTVGCFDFYFPAFFDLRNAKDPASAITGIKEQMRQILPHGMNYGLLRYLAIDSETGKQMRSLPQPEVKFNFPASLDLPLGSESGFEGTLERVRGEHSPDAARSHILEINHSVSTGKLVAEWFFSADQYQPVTIERLALCYIDSLRALIAHCHSPEAGGFTASDFSDFGWGQEDLNDILSAIGGGDEVDPLFHVEDGSERNE